jgi:hypothetical protein
VEEDQINTEPIKTRWAIDLDWFQQNSRSIVVLLTDYLCPKCAKKLNIGEKEHPPEVLLNTIQKCCCQTTNFINDRLPILEGIFRLYLSNGNQPLDLDELGNQLSRLRGGDPYRTSPESLLRLLKNDRYYGLQETSD